MEKATKQMKHPITKGAARVPVVMQMEALECGAASLTMILAYYDKWIPLEQVRVDCGVSRDGSNAKNVLKAARSYGLTAKGYRFEPEDLREQGKFPCIIHWNFNHFLVLNGFKGNKAVLNDPAKGTYSVSMDVFDKSFTGICLMFEPSESFQPGGKPKSTLSFARARLKGTGEAVAFTVISTVIASLIIILVTLIFTLATTFYQMRISRQQMELSVQESGVSYALITGIQKIKLSGAEKRAFARWSSLYAKEVQMSYNPPAFLRFNAAFSTAISLTGTIVMYYMSVKSGISVADYYAFNTACGMVSGAFLSLAGIATTLAQIRPILELTRPVLEAVPEVSEGKQVLSRLSGGIELSNVSFRYNENMPLVIDDLSLKIRPGQYVAIVGETGCGKSTLMRILLGFEKPLKGAVYYDGKDLAALDLKSLRRRIGVVMQNGKLFQGDIYSNIVISAPQLTMDQAWEAAEMAGIAEDIRRMPMGMHTIISEGSGGISGGQRQRLMIARAIAPKPKILMFDEATSALDNVTQKIVSDSLESLKCTRIVIAHRLSTIRQCDRIIYLEKGKIVEDGTYEELIARNGRFAELVERQRLDK